MPFGHHGRQLVVALQERGHVAHLIYVVAGAAQFNLHVEVGAFVGYVAAPVDPVFDDVPGFEVADALFGIGNAQAGLAVGGQKRFVEQGVLRYQDRQ